jgi:hypothetical protein
MRRAAGALATLIASAALLAGGVDPAGGAFPGSDGLIAFDRQLNDPNGRGFVKRIATVKESGEKLNAITPRCCKYPEQPAWSPNGERIAFSSGRHIFTINKKGKKLERLTRASGTTATSSGISAPRGHPAASRSCLRATTFSMRTSGATCS